LKDATLIGNNPKQEGDQGGGSPGLQDFSWREHWFAQHGSRPWLLFLFALGEAEKRCSDAAALSSAEETGFELGG
jgi:hypothetical protein